jgi:hypothetical protein
MDHYGTPSITVHLLLTPLVFGGVVTIIVALINHWSPGEHPVSPTPTPVVAPAQPSPTRVVTPPEPAPVPKRTPTPPEAKPVANPTAIPEWIRSMPASTPEWVRGMLATIVEWIRSTFAATVEWIRYFRLVFLQPLSRPFYSVVGLFLLCVGAYHPANCVRFPQNDPGPIKRNWFDAIQ